jgi:uncharacterized phage protein (TIGR01671 family)
MSRPLKFRAWDDKRRAMWPLDLDDYGAKERLDLILGFGTLMQYTGLKDKNGVEIYEFDILATDVPGEEPQIGQVQFVDGCFYRTYQQRKPSDLPYNFIDAGHCKVIGNFYEHPELLG